MYKFRLTYDEWKSLVKKTRKGVFCHTKKFSGYVGLLNADEVTDKQVWDHNGSKITVLDKGYKWLSVLPEDEYYCITVMMNEKYEIQVSYIDMIDGQGVDEDGVPFCYDCYLDLVVYPDGEVKVDDRDELDEALAKNDITKEQYDRAIETADKLQKGLLKDYSEYCKFICSLLGEDIWNCTTT